MRKDYGKLIRDRIPEILEAEGLLYEVARLDGGAFRTALLAKLLEDAGEAAEARDADALARELADLFEVIDAVLELHGLDPAAVRALQARCREERGGVREEVGAAVDGGVRLVRPEGTRRQEAWGRPLPVGRWSGGWPCSGRRSRALPRDGAPAAVVGCAHYPTR